MKELRYREPLYVPYIFSPKQEELKKLNKLSLESRNSTIKSWIKQGRVQQYGHAVLDVYNSEGKFKQRGEGFNLVVDAGLKALIDVAIAASTNTINNMAFGTSTQAAAAGDTDMIAPATPAQRIIAGAGGRFRTTKLMTISVLIPTTSYTRPITITEMGPTFDPNSNGALFARAVITGVTLNAGDTGRAIYEIQF